MRNACLIALLMLACVPLLFAQPAPAPARQTVGALVAQLDDPDYDKRLQATQSLLADASLDTRVLAQYYEKATSAEQRHRLIDITLHHVVFDYVSSLSVPDTVGAIGTSLQPALTAAQMPDLNTPAVRVGQPRAGFPAYARLLPGDLIVSFNDKPFPSTRDGADVLASLLKSINTSQPGSKIRLGIYRAGSVTNIELPVFSYAVLTSVYQPNNLNPRTGMPRQWDEFTQKFGLLAADSTSRVGVTDSPRPIELGALLLNLPAWSMPAAEAAEAVPLNRPPAFRPVRRGGPFVPDEPQENEARD